MPAGRIRDYRETDEPSWLRCWLRAAGASSAWLYVIRDKPEYGGEALELVSLGEEGGVSGLLDIQVEPQPGELCMREESRAAIAWEFAVLPELWGRGIGSQLLIEAEERLRSDWGVRYVEWWSMDPRAQKWYQRRGMECINAHWRFHVRADESFRATCASIGVEPVNLHLTCSTADWPEVREHLDIIHDPPLQPRLCRGYSHRF